MPEQRSRRLAAALGALLAAGLLALPGCAALERAREGFRAPPPEPPPTLIPLDPFAEPPAPLPSFLPELAISSAQGVAERVRADAPLLEHLRRIDADYAGRRNPRLRWTVEVRRIEPITEGERTRPGSWDVRVVSSPIRGSLVFYGCKLGFAFSGEALHVGRPAELCGWRDQETESS